MRRALPAVRFARVLGIVLLAVWATPAAFAQSDLPAGSGWTVRIDRARVISDQINRRARQAGAPLFVTGRLFDISREQGNDHAFDERQALVDNWAQHLSERLERYGFRETSGASFQALFHMSLDEFRDNMIHAQPYGARDQIERSAGELFFMLNRRPSGCHYDEGAYAVLVMAFYPVEGVANEYGSVGLFLVGAGECASRGSGRRNLADIETELSVEFSGRRD